jgi:hypothetical protein
MANRVASSLVSSRLVSSRLVSFWDGRDVCRRLFVPSLAALSVVMAPGASPAAQTQWGEFSVGSGSSLGTYPLDCGTSNDHRRGGVRFANPSSNATVVELWDLTGTTLPTSSLAAFGGTIGSLTLKSGEQVDLSTGLFNYRPSDAIELTNDWCVSIGTGGTGAIDETYIEVIGDIGSTSPIFVDQFQITPVSGSYDTTRAGFAHDLAITRDAKWAVVNSENWIHLVALDSTTWTATRTSLNIGGGSAGPCNPNSAVDSVAVTNERAVVTTWRWNPAFNTYTTWVYIVDLTPTSGPVVVLEHDLAPPREWEPTGDDHDFPHDVAITPTRDGGGRTAVVTTNHATAFYDLTTNSFLDSDFDVEFTRAYQVQVDSVEVTGKNAVVIADRTTSGTPKYWAVKIYDLTSSTIALPIAYYSDTSTPEGGSRAHDLAIDWDSDRGLVRTSYTNVVLTSLSSPPTSPLDLPSPNGSDAYRYETYASSTGRPVFSSDSTVLGTEDDGVLYGVTIGARVGSSGFIGTVDIINLLASSPSVTQVDILPDTSEENAGCVPLDLAISFDQASVVVRSTDPVTQSAPTGDGPDYEKIPLAGGASTRFGGSGTVFGLDSLATPGLFGYVRTNRRILSISQDPSAGGLDYTHIAR